MLRYVCRDLLHNPRRTLASLMGVTLGVGLFSGLLFFMDGSGATMTERAVAPLPLDMQFVLTSTPGEGLRLTEQVSPATLEQGGEAIITLTVTNDGVASANEVTVTDVPPPPLTYVNGTTDLDATPIPDVGGQSPLSHGAAGFGLDVGSLGPGATATISYAVNADQAVDDVGTLPLGGTVSSREQVVPAPANAPRTLTLDALRDEVATISGVDTADGLSFVDLMPASLAAGPLIVRHPVRVFAFDENYQQHYPSIALDAGGFERGGALLSAEAARSLKAEPGTTIELHVPGLAAPLSLALTGVVDLTRSQPLFSSRKSSKLEEFLYVPNTVVVPPEMFREVIIPAFGRAQATVGSVTKSFPVLELDVRVDRTRLKADPAAALDQTMQIASAVDRVGLQQGYLIDNISNALAVASDDATTGKRMFLFLGLPGVLMATFLASYAGGVLAASERREHANLRVRGAHRGHLRTIALYKALAFAGVGSIIGIALGFVSVGTILGWSRLLQAAPRELAVSGLIAAGAGALITAVALYVPARRSVNREISQERREMQTFRTPSWLRLRLDLILLAAAGVAEFVAVRTGALAPVPGSVYSGVAVSLPFRLLLAPMLAWVGGVLLCVRVILWIAARASREPSTRSASVTRGILSRSLRRRPWGLASGIIGLGLVVSFGTGLAIFTATYDATKAADARFLVGSDLHIIPSVMSPRRHLRTFASELAVPGVAAVTPVVFGIENSLMTGPYNQHRQNLAAIDARTFTQVAPLPASVFGNDSGDDVLAALGSNPHGVLVDTETADDLQVEAGDTVDVTLALGTTHETKERFRVIALFDRFPAFPEGADLVVNLDRYLDATGLRHVDFFLAKASDPGHTGLTRTLTALREGPGRDDPLHVDTPATALDKDQSSLTAVNVKGLVSLDALYVLLMSAAAMAIFIFGLMLQRRKEYVTLRALGLQVRDLHALVLAEAALVAACGLAVGTLVGMAVASLMVHMLRALFILDPAVTFPLGRMAMLTTLVLGATLLCGLAATETLRRLSPTEILREE